MAEAKNSAKAFFQQLWDIEKQISVKEEQIERLKSLAMKVTAAMLEVNSKPSGVSRSTEDTMAKIIDLQNELIAEVNRLTDLKREAYAILRLIPNEKQRRSLEYRYLNCNTMEKVGEKLGCSTYWARETIKAALAEAEKNMKNAE